MTAIDTRAGQATTPRPAAPPGAQVHEYPDQSQVVRILLALMAGMFLAALDQTIVSTSIRTIADDLGGLDRQAWATTAYLITSTIATPLYGKLSDIYGRRRFFLFAIAVFVFGSALCTMSTSMYMLAAFRAVQGIGAGGLFSLALAIIGDIVPPRERARYQGFFLAVFGTSSVLGPVVGGLLADQSTIFGIAGWRYVFLINVPIGIAAFIGVYINLHTPHTRVNHRVDWWGAAALIVALVPLLVVAEQGREWGWTSTTAITCYAVGVAGLVLLLLAERKAGYEALIPLRLFTNPHSGVPLLVGVFVGFGMFGAMMTLPLWMQIVHGYTAIQSGLAMLPLTGGIMLASIVSGQLISRTGQYKVFPVVGTALMTLGVFMLSRLSVDIDMWYVAASMAVFGLGLGNCMQPLTLAVQNAVDRRDMGIATSAATFFRQMGGTLGTAVLLSILFSTVQDKIADAYRGAAGTPAFQAALHDPAVIAEPANKPILGMLQGGGAGSGTSPLSDTAFLSSADPRLTLPFRAGFSDSIDLVLVCAVAVLALTFVLTLFIPERPLAARTPEGHVETAAQPAAVANEMGVLETTGTEVEAAAEDVQADESGPSAQSGVPAEKLESVPVAGASTPIAGASSGEPSVPVAAPLRPKPVAMLDYPFPLRPGVQARLTLPEDLTSAEAARLAAHLETLVVPEPWERS